MLGQAPDRQSHQDQDRNQHDRRWARATLIWGVTAVAAVLVAAVMFALDQFGALGGPPPYVSSGAGGLRDDAAFYLGQFTWQHSVLWYTIIRTSVLPLTYLGLLILIQAADEATGRRLTSLRISSVLALSAAAPAILSALLVLATTRYYIEPWDRAPAEIMAPVGRIVDAIGLTADWMQFGSYALSAVSLLYLANACRTAPELPRRITWLLWINAALLGSLFIVALIPTFTLDSWTISVRLVVGIVGTPVLIAWLSRHLWRHFTNTARTVPDRSQPYGAR